MSYPSVFFFPRVASRLLAPSLRPAFAACCLPLIRFPNFTPFVLASSASDDDSSTRKRARNPVRIRLKKKALKLAEENAAAEAAAAAAAAIKAAGPPPVDFLSIDTVLEVARNGGVYKAALEEGLQSGEIKLAKQVRLPKKPVPIVLQVFIKVTNGTPPMKGLAELPHLFGRRLKILCIAEPDSPAGIQAKEAGADLIGCSDELFHSINQKKCRIDAALTTNEFYHRAIRVARFLGPLGIMPSIRRGTVTTDIPATITSMRRSVRFNSSTGSTVSAVIGTHAMTTTQIDENVEAFITNLVFLCRQAQGTQLSPSEFIQSVKLAPHLMGTFPIDRVKYIKAASAATDAMTILTK